MSGTANDRRPFDDIEDGTESFSILEAANAQQYMNKPTISAQILRHMANCLRLTGRSPEGILLEIDLDPSELDDPKATIPLEKFLSFVDLASRRSANANFGLYAGRLAASDSLGPLGFLFLSAPTFRAAFNSFNAYLATIQDATHNRFFEEEGLATFEYGITDQSLENREQDAEFSLAVMHSFCLNYLGSDFELAEVRLEHACLSDPKIYRDFFRCDVYFDQDINSFSFENRFLDRTGGAIDPALFPIIEEHVRRKVDDHCLEKLVSEQARRIVDVSNFAQTPTLEEAASMIGISVATLNRRLRNEGVSWRAMVQERRMNAAARLLKQSRRDVADIALAVGYSESASFVRSFKRHYGITPKRYRKN